MPIRTARFAELEARTMYELLRLRCTTFVVEQHCAYLDLDGRDLEPETVHLWCDQDGTPVTYLRVLREQDGSARIGRVCTAATHRGKGYAGTLVTAALALIGPAGCRIEAQAQLVDYYARFGFVVSGLEYLEDDIPHVPMHRDAPSP